MSTQGAFQSLNTKLNAETHKQVSEGGCSKSLAVHLQGGNSVVVSVGSRLKNNPYSYNYGSLSN